MKKIVRNRIKCKKCGEIIESTSRHDFKFFVMDETGRPYEPVEPEYERAVQETPESLAFEEELIQRFRLQDGKK